MKAMQRVGVTTSFARMWLSFWDLWRVISLVGGSRSARTAEQVVGGVPNPWSGLEIQVYQGIHDLGLVVAKRVVEHGREL